MESPTLKGNKKKHRKQASTKQLVAIQLVAQGLTKTQAMRKAGYSEKTINTPKQVFTSQAIVTAVDKFKLELKDKGLTTDYMAAKIQEWLEALDPKGNPDYLVQQNAYKFLKEVLIDEEKKKDQPIKKTLTLTEYLTPTNTTISDTTIPDSSVALDLDTIEDVADTNAPHIIDSKVSDITLKGKQETLEELII